MSNPQIWWYVTRASALIAWVSLVISVIWGILLSTRILKRFDNPAWLLDLHSWLSGIAVVMTGLHMFSLYADNYAHFSIPDLFIPFNSNYTKIASLGPLPVALGVICTYILIAVQSTSLLMRWLPRKFWKAIHYMSYLLVILVSFHAGWLGTDTRAPVYKILALTLIMLTTIALVIRILLPKSARELSASVEKRRPNKRDASSHQIKVWAASNPVENIKLIKFKKIDESDFPFWQGGSHVTLHLPDGLDRQYSLCGDPLDRNTLQIAVELSANSRGGSKWINENLVEGSIIEISGPFNNFELRSAPSHCFIAGGIGITPIKAMIDSLSANRKWKLFYLGPEKSEMLFAQELASVFGDRVTIHESKVNKSRLDFAQILKDYTGQVYACGSDSIIEDLQKIIPAERLHIERFSPINRSDEIIAIDYEVELQRSRKKFSVVGGENLLEKINANGGEVFSSCNEGICGTCEVRVLSGTPLHLDSVMSDQDKDELGVMYPCVSRSREQKLVLDI